MATMFTVGCLTEDGTAEPIAVLFVDPIPEMPGYDSLTLAEEFTASLMRGEEGANTCNVTCKLREGYSRFFGLTWFLTDDSYKPIAYFSDHEEGQDIPEEPSMKLN